MAAQNLLGEKSVAVYELMNLMKTDKEEKVFKKKIKLRTLL